MPEAGGAGKRGGSRLAARDHPPDRLPCRTGIGGCAPSRQRSLWLDCNTSARGILRSKGWQKNIPRTGNKWSGNGIKFSDRTIRVGSP